MTVRRKNVKRIIKNSVRQETASEAIGIIEPGVDIFGFTKGDFSKIDILMHLLDQTGPAHVDIGTWTAADAELDHTFGMFSDGRFLSLRWMVDRSFPNRQKEYFKKLVGHFGLDCVRIARFHAKFLRIQNEKYHIGVRTSMNLNLNRRIESFEITEGGPIPEYMREIVDYHFSFPLADSYAAYKSFEFKDTKKAVEKNEYHTLDEFPDFSGIDVSGL